MSVIDQRGNIHRGTGIGGGQFVGHQRSAPTGGLDDFEAPRELTPADVRNADFTIAALEEHLGTSLIPDFKLADGTPVYGIRHGEDLREAVAIGGDGEILAHADLHLHGWIRREADHPRRHELTTALRRARLVAAGFQLDGKPGAGTGAYGMRKVGARCADSWQPVAEINKELRADISRAVQFGALPDNLDYRVRGRSGSLSQAIDIEVYGVPDADALTETGDYRGKIPSAHALSLEATLEAIGDQYNDVDRDMYTDYNNSRFYLNVTIKDERTVEWERQQKADAKRRRDAKAAQR